VTGRILVGILIGASAVPALCGVVIGAMWAADRFICWLQRLYPGMSYDDAKFSTLLVSFSIVLGALGALIAWGSGR
jgi:hypothetical protein